MIFRQINYDDIDRYWELQKQLDSETIFMLYEAGERKKDPTQIREMIRPVVEGQDFFEVAEMDGQLVGFLSARRGKISRTHHRMLVCTGVLKAFQNQGVASTFFAHLDVWAREHAIKRLELVVMAPNDSAIRLYEKAGFVSEGIARYAIVVDGKSIDEHTMAKLIDSAE